MKAKKALVLLLAFLLIFTIQQSVFATDNDDGPGSGVVEPVGPNDPDDPTVDPDDPTIDPNDPIVDPDDPIVDPDVPIIDPNVPIIDPNVPIVDPNAEEEEKEEPVVVEIPNSAPPRANAPASIPTGNNVTEFSQDGTAAGGDYAGEFTIRWNGQSAPNAATITFAGNTGTVLIDDAYYDFNDSGNNRYGKLKFTIEQTCQLQEVVFTLAYPNGTREVTVNVAALAHNFVWTVTQAPTCLDAGEETEICSRCDVEGDTRPVAALGHDFAWTVTQAPTCLDAGEETEICSRCATERNTRTVAALGHDWDSGVDSICDDCGFVTETLYTCKREGCNATRSEQYDDTHTVTFNSNGSPIAVTEVECGKTVNEPDPDPERDGFLFVGWYLEGATEAYDFDTPVTADIELYAVWGHTVTYNANGGAGSPFAVQVAEGGYHFVLSSAEVGISRDGYHLLGWNENPDADTAQYEVGGTITTIDNNITLYAVWEVNEYTVSFDSNGGSPEPVVQTVEHGDTATEPAAPTRDGFEFGGWFINEELTNRYIFSNPVTTNITLYAKWDEPGGDITIYHAVTFNLNYEGSPDPEELEVADGGRIQEPATPTRAGYTFGGWYLGDELYDFSTPVTGDTTLTAQWTLIYYTVTFNSNGGSVVASQTVASGNTAREPADPTRAGYTFDGWYLNGVLYDFDTPVTGNITLTARWTAITGSTGSSNDRDTTTTTTAATTAATPTTTITDPATPLAQAPANIPEPADETTIPDEYVPLGNLPQTGAAGIFNTGMVLSLLSVLVCALGLALTSKRRERE